MLRRPLEPAQYLSIRYICRLTEASIETSDWHCGDVRGNAVAGSAIDPNRIEHVVPNLRRVCTKSSSRRSCGSNSLMLEATSPAEGAPPPSTTVSSQKSRYAREPIHLPGTTPAPGAGEYGAAHPAGAA